MVYLLINDFKQENMQTIQNNILNRKIITDRENLDFFLSNFKQNEIYLFSKYYVENYENVIESIPLFLNKYEKLYSNDYIICGKEELVENFKKETNKFHERM